MKIFNDNQHAESKVIDRKISYSRFWKKRDTMRNKKCTTRF